MDTQVNSVEEIKEVVNASGSYFFSPSTMRYWHCRVMSQVFPAEGGTYFVTSDKWYDEKRLYSVRFCDYNGSIETRYHFNTRKQALGAAKRLSKS
jgi:hypothetical protein